MTEKERVAEQLKVFLKVVKENKDWHELLDYIFTYHLTVNNKKSVFSDLTEHIAETFRVNPDLLISYINFNGEITFEDLNLNQATYKNLFEFVRNIKSKHGNILRRIMQANSDPFLIRGTEVNVKTNASTHNLKFMRNDGEELNFNFRTDSLFPVLSVLSQALAQSIQQGIYSLDSRTIDNYLTSSKQLIGIIEQITNEQDTIREEN